MDPRFSTRNKVGRCGAKFVTSNPFATVLKPLYGASLSRQPAGHQLVDAFRRAAGANAYYDWQGGLVWMRMEADPEAEILRKLIDHLGGGHATLIRASEKLRAGTPVFHPQPPALAGLSARLKEQFDPKNILNFGRMASTADGAKVVDASLTGGPS